MFGWINVLTTDSGREGQQIVRHFIGAKSLNSIAACARTCRGPNAAARVLGKLRGSG